MSEIKTILGFGASSMQGVKDSKGGFLRRLEQNLNRDSKKFNVVNLGVGGDTTRDMLARIDVVEKHQPNCAIILLGCNDMPRAGDGESARRTSLEEYAANLKRIFPKLRSKRSIFLTSFYVKWIKEDLFVQYMETAKTLAAGYEIWDLFHDSRPLLSNYLADDFVHFNDEGHQYICDHLLKILATGNLSIRNNLTTATHKR